MSPSPDALLKATRKTEVANNRQKDIQKWLSLGIKVSDSEIEASNLEIVAARAELFDAERMKVCQ
jgi:hypothetical protein